MCFQVRREERRKSVLLVDGGLRTHDPKTYGPADDAIFKELEGISPFDHLQKVNQLPT